MRSTGPTIMKSGPKNMPPPQPHPQSCIMASLASIIFCESSKPRLKNRRRNRFDAGQGGYAVDLRILRTEGADRAGLGGVVAWPSASHAQQSTMPVVGLLSGFSATSALVADFHRGLKEFALVEGENVAIDYRSVNG